ncbi:ABC transporter permease [Conexibacter sp. SYSU D00693]|uniref:ABC transporter permease n=1 Tax=Conexibacter sp. SYSU D00693 TaxID=2812560 RepID=UPI00196A5338|nr:ABC transporter permease [Conexibacter sp. SYSU D00693]
MSLAAEHAGEDVREAPVVEKLQAALAEGERPPRPSAWASSVAFGWRGMLRIKHVPEQLLDVTITPVLFLLMFTYLFGGAVEGSTDAYLQYLLPGMLVQSVLFTTVYSGVTANTDRTSGATDRFRTLAMWRPSPLVGVLLSDVVRYGVASVIVVALGLVLGFDADGGVGGIALAILLVAAFAFSLAWLFTCVGMVMRSPNAVMNTGFMALFPLIFLSNVFVDPSTLPAALEAFVDVNPISHLTTAVRGLMAGDAAGEDVLLVLGEAAVITAVFAPLTARLYHRG